MGQGKSKSCFWIGNSSITRRYEKMSSQQYYNTYSFYKKSKQFRQSCEDTPEGKLLNFV